MKINIRESATLLAAVAILAGVQAGSAEARGGASDRRYESASTTTSRPVLATDRQKAVIKDSSTSDADPAGWFDLEWSDFERQSDRPSPFPRHRVPRGR
jgi:hypothetical protein